jgi:hypothetical protein
MSTEAIFNLRVNTGNSIEDINDFDKSVDNLNKSIQDTQTTLESGKGIDAFEKNLDDLDKKLKEGNLSIRQQSKLIKEYQTIALQAGESSPIGQRAINSAAELTDRLGDLRNQTTALSSDTVKLDTALQGIETGAAVFQGLQSAIALTGVENEDLVKTMVKLQAVQGVVNAVNVVARNLQKDQILGLQLRIGLEKAKNFILTGSIAGTASLSGAEKELGASTLFTAGAMKALRAALIATGIGALIVLLGYLINNFDKVTAVVQKMSGYVLKAYDYFDNLGVAVKVLIGIFFPFIGLVYGAIKALEYFNIIDSKTERDQQQRHEANIRRIDKELAKREKQREIREKQFNAEQKGLEREIALLEAQGKSSDALTEKKIKNSIAYQKEQLNELKLNERILQATNALGANDDLIKETQNAIIEITESIKDSENQLKVNSAQNARERAEEAKKLAKKVIDTSNLATSLVIKNSQKELQVLIDNQNKKLEVNTKFQDIQFELLELYEAVVKSSYQIELEDFEKAQESKQMQLQNALAIGLITYEEYNNALVKLEEQTQKGITDIKKKEAEEQKKIDAEKFQEQIKNIEKVLEVAQGVQNTFTAFNSLLNTQDNERLKQVRGNTAEEEKIKRRMFEREKKMRLAQVAIDTASAIVKAVAASPTTFGLPFSAFALATGIANAAAIKATTFDSSSGTPSSGGTPSTGATASSFTQQSNQTTETNLTGVNLPTQNTTKVVVLESDITKIQNRVKVQEATSTY